MFLSDIVATLSSFNPKFFTELTLNDQNHLV